MLKTSETVNALVRAKARIDHPSKWCKGYTIIGSRRCMVGSNLDDSGAIVDDAQHIHFAHVLAVSIVRLFPKRVLDGNVADFNDHPYTTHTDVMRVFDDAIYTEE